MCRHVNSALNQLQTCRQNRPPLVDANQWTIASNGPYLDNDCHDQGDAQTGNATHAQVLDGLHDDDHVNLYPSDLIENNVSIELRSLAI